VLFCVLFILVLLYVLFVLCRSVLFVCKCVLYNCHRVATQLQLTNISIGVCMCECFDNCVGVLVICVLVFSVFYIVCTVFLYCSVYVYLLLFITSVRTTATD
jgi:hypothetical protein